MSSNNNKPIRYVLESDEEARKPFLENDKSRNTLDSTSEEPSDSPGQKFSKRKRLFILCVAAISVLVVVVVCVALTQGKHFLGLGRHTRISSTDRKFSLNDIFGDAKYRCHHFSASWVSDESFQRHSEEGELVEFNMNTDETTTIMSHNETQQTGFISVKEAKSPDGKWFLFTNRTTRLYRHSFYADYYIKNLKTNKITKLHTPNDDDEQIRYCSWSTVGSALVFVHKCNIYYIPRATEPEDIKYYTITDNGVPKKVFNGVPDWVYEEEIISSTHAIEFSSDGKFMSYVMFNATLVPFYRFPRYGPQSNMYPSIERIAYPKAGFPNPTIKITVVDLDLTISQEHAARNHLIPPGEISAGEYYYTVMKFSEKFDEKNQVFIQWMNRAQNKTICMLYGMTDPNGYVVEEHEVENGWIDDDYQIPMFAKDGSYYITMLPQSVAGKGEFRHLVKVKVDNPKLKNMFEFLTEGAFTVHDITCWNLEEEVVYFRSTEMSPQFRHVYSYNLTSKEKKCISCGLIKDNDGTNCTYHGTKFSTKCSWVILICQGPFLPRTIMFGLKTGKKVVLVTNNDTREALKEKDLPVEVYYTINSDGFDIPVKEIRPKNFDPKKKYAILFDVYGGPNTQKVTNVYNKVGFHTFFVTSYDIIVVNFDARGSGYYGYKFLYAVYRKLGYYESKDAVAVAKYLQTKSYVDPTKIAIWGWSYGGFYAATTLAVSKGVINTAVSVAPVTDWRYYDTVYSERYMGFPSKEDNLDGYRRTSVMYKAKDFAGKNFMLIHGTADDNVHFQNSAQLAAALIDAQVYFSSQFYTDRDHNIQSNGHIWSLIADYLVTKLTEHPFSKYARFGFNIGDKK